MGLWVTIVIWALFVAVTLWPPVRRGWAGFLVFLMTMTPNELPLVLLVVFGLAVGPAVLAPPIGETTDTIAVLAASLVAAGLVWVQVRARSTARVLDAALRDGLTPQGWDRPPTRPAVSVWWRGILLPFQRHGRAVRRIGGVAYGPLPAHRLDLYLPRNRAPSGPVLVHLHGGGFVQGRKSREGVTLLNQLAARGWLCASANYRLRVAGRFPHPLEDAKRAIAWLRDHAGDYGADRADLVLVGSSAGGHLAVSAALTANQPRFQPGFEHADTTVAAAVVLYGYLGPRSHDPASDPGTLIRPDAPPMMFLHGTADTLIQITRGDPAPTVVNTGLSARTTARGAAPLAALPTNRPTGSCAASAATTSPASPTAKPQVSSWPSTERNIATTPAQGEPSHAALAGNAALFAGDSGSRTRRRHRTRPDRRNRMHHTRVALRDRPTRDDRGIGCFGEMSNRRSVAALCCFQAADNPVSPEGLLRCRDNAFLCRLLAMDCADIAKLVAAARWLAAPVPWTGKAGQRHDEVDPVTRTPSWRVPLSGPAGEDVLDGNNEEAEDVHPGVPA